MITSVKQPSIFITLTFLLMMLNAISKISNKLSKGLKMWATYEQWKTLGRFVRKGERSLIKDNYGVALFKFEQTDKQPVYKVTWYDGRFE
jgi:hypothetical protein